MESQPVLEEVLLALQAAQCPVALHAQVGLQRLGLSLIQIELAVPAIAAGSAQCLHSMAVPVQAWQHHAPSACLCISGAARF